MIGPTFSAELQAAGLNGLPFSWGADGVTYSDRITPQQRADIEVVLAAHNPTDRPVDRKATLRSEIMGATTIAQLKIAVEKLL